MFGIGFSEMLLIGVIALIAVGPKRLPQLMKTVGKGIREIRRASTELRRASGIDEMMREADVRQMLREPAHKPTPRALTQAELDAERPVEGVDVAEAHHRAQMGESMAAVRPATAPEPEPRPASEPPQPGPVAAEARPDSLPPPPRSLPPPPPGAAPPASVPPARGPGEEGARRSAPIPPPPGRSGGKP